MKKILSLILCISIVISYSSVVLADTIEDEEGIQMYNLDEEVTDFGVELEDAYVDTKSLTPDVLDIIEKYISFSDEDNKYIITDEIKLKSLLSEEQYRTLETQIELKNKYSTATILERSGSNQYNLNDGEKKTVISSDCWFSCNIWGATDFDIVSSKSANITIYKKTLFGKKLLKDINMKSFKYTLSDSAINTGKNTYLVRVKLNSSSRISCKINTHTDVFKRSAGAMWISNSNSAIYDTNILYLKYWYMPASKISALVDYVDQDSFLDNQKLLLDGSITAVAIAAGIISTGTSKVLPSILTTVIGGVGGFALTQLTDFKTAVKKNIRTAGGYNSRTKRYTKGVLLIQYMSQGITFYEVKTWNNSTMYGPKGWTGNWTIEYN